MASAFAVYLELGFRHIADLAGYDHILFIVALAAGYRLSRWRHLLILVTAFTIGHSMTLALATLDVVRVSTDWVEFLIPLTILLTALFTLQESWRRPTPNGAGHAREVKYGMALFFGLIHGLGFSNYLRALLGGEESLAWPLFSFNVGLEVGQIAILTAILVITAGATGPLHLPPRVWTRLLSLGTAVPAGWLAASRLPV